MRPRRGFLCLFGVLHYPILALSLVLAGFGPTTPPATAGLNTNIMFAALKDAPKEPAGNKAEQEEQYREREVFNPETGEWVAEPAEPAAGPADELDQARALLAENKPADARKLLQAWIKANAGHDRYYEAVFLLGETWFESKDYYRAYQQYELVVENTGGDLFRSALNRERDVALAFLSGQKRIVWRVFRFPATDEAIDILDRIWERAPGTSLGEEALRTKADFRFNKGEMDLAQDEYANLAREYPGGRYAGGSFTSFCRQRMS